MPRAFLLKSKKFRSYRFHPVDPHGDEILTKITHDSRQRQRSPGSADREGVLCMKIEDEYPAENVSVEVKAVCEFPRVIITGIIIPTARSRSDSLRM